MEQNAAVARELFATVLEDHYLSFTSEKTGEEAEEQDAGRRFLAFYRYWQEPVIVTTLAKMWEVLFSPRANDTMSFHRLSRVIVLLDEPQSIPAACWEGFGKTLTLLSGELGTVFILMTATQPGIVAGRELTPVPVNFPAVRHEFHWLNRRLTLAEAADFLYNSGYMIIKQAQHYLAPEERLELARSFVTGAIKNIKQVLAYCENRGKNLLEALGQIDNLAPVVDRVGTIEELMAIEGNIREFPMRTFVLSIK